MRLVVFGGRNFADVLLLTKVLDAVHRVRSVTRVIVGRYRGADALAEQWAASLDLPVDPFPAEWTKYKRRAGPIRNQRMIDEGRPDYGVGFPGGAGTADMARRLKAAGIGCLLVKDRGEPAVPAPWRQGIIKRAVEFGDGRMRTSCNVAGTETGRLPDDYFVHDYRTGQLLGRMTLDAIATTYGIDQENVKRAIAGHGVCDVFDLNDGQFQIRITS